MKWRRKIKRKWKNTSKNKKMMILFVGIISIISVGYASINQLLTLKGYASIDLGDGILFHNITATHSSGIEMVTDPSIKSKTLVSLNAAFEKNSSLTLTVNGGNYGKKDAKLIEVEAINHNRVKSININ